FTKIKEKKFGSTSLSFYQKNILEE
ncbi:16S rRNA (guanine(966)-N(2))-methyltransferase RsmD, partial [Campylobacter coli]|nr:16S rRNA (guanine(966)-N(2))-methyltransferase RsmD [Campylobacter coli]ECH5566845.1 16S rRNA (guanine(966)-N(2))-methyltransferase RsmD [Campylobacter coli]EJE3547850.1 16S rRNA (guanine(966)-N(2))-methyltransferase RsmD [Campylobacter coli]EJX6109863.1 16S rRNA (guanine(966)-N(2))-methyltransferase RsmD [Campylobacter coli]EKY3854909.1 16S rRNA (guanine(966)-N(2))-methyltransferase RsmD [Campylobacter coli]